MSVRRTGGGFGFDSEPAYSASSAEMFSSVFFSISPGLRDMLTAAEAPGVEIYEPTYGLSVEWERQTVVRDFSLCSTVSEDGYFLSEGWLKGLSLTKGSM